MKKIVETTRLIIREFKHDDVNDLYRLESDPRIFKYIPGKQLLTFNQCKRMIKKYISNYKKGKLSRWAVILKDTNQFIGITGFNYLKKINKVEIGTKIIPEYWGNRYATELSEGMINYGLWELGLDEIIAITDENNITAIKSLENIGMTYVKHGIYNGANVVFYHATK